MIQAETVRLEFIHSSKRWKFPDNRFVSYEKSDESWCRFFGMGKEITVEERTVIPQATITGYRVTPINTNSLQHSVNFRAVPTVEGEFVYCAED